MLIIVKRNEIVEKIQHCQNLLNTIIMDKKYIMPMLKKYQNTCMRFQKEESDIKNIIETKLVRAAEIAVNQELTEEQKKEVIEIDKLGII